ncbi:MAG: metallophosphoesterase [Bryobacteraceae bacterium]
MARPILTLIHLSDPHFGSRFIIDGESKWRSLVPRVPLLKHISGWFPHGYQTALQLAIAVRTILRRCDDERIPWVVVHTGDLTATGSTSEFSVGATFFRHGHHLENGEVAGLMLETAYKQLPFDIPGNHDLWSRNNPKQGSAFNSHYGRSYPFEREIPAGTHRIVLHGLDSNRSSRWSHRLANGEIPPAAFATLCSRLRERKGAGVIQIVCLHHPLALTDGTEPRLWGHEILKLRNRSAIAAELSEAGADVALSGHVHQERFHDLRGLLHFIAGSACQIGCRPSFWRLDLFAEGIQHRCYYLPEGGFHQFRASPRGRAAFAERAEGRIA